MRSQSLVALAGAVAAVSAQTLSTPTLNIPTSFGVPTLSSGGAVSTNLPDLVSRLPRCAIDCLADAAEDVKCNVGDFNCLCKNAQDLVTRLGPCVLLSSSCSDGDKTRAAEIAPQICAAVNLNPNPAAVASASNLVTSAVGPAPTQTPNAAAQHELSNIGLGMAGVFVAWVAAM